MLYGKSGKADDLVISGAWVIDPGRGISETLDVRIDGGVIERLAPAGSAERNGHRVIDAEGCVLAPAFIDPHVHFRTPGREHEEDLASGSRAAAAGGYCAVLAMPNTDPVVDSSAVLGSLIETARRESDVPVGFFASVTKGQEGDQLSEMAELADTGAVGFTDDGQPIESPGVLRHALQYGAVTDRPIAVHCEERSLSRGGQVHEGALSAELGLSGYPSIAESLMVSRDLAIAAYERRPIHLMHLSAKESVEALRQAHTNGVSATAEATPHHLCITHEAVRELDPNCKMNPPLRAEADRAALIDALRDGTIAAVATDHAPHAREEKDVPFESAPFGVIGLETAFPVLYTRLVEPGLLSLETLLERMSAGPARAFGLPIPRIETGVTANLVLLDLHSAWRVDEAHLCSKSGNSWLLGETVKGRICTTVADGRLVYAA